jgi:hypothetical protein
MMNSNVSGNIEGILSRREMKGIKAGFGGNMCHVYCCDSNGNCTSSGTANPDLDGTTNEECQSSAISEGYSCPSGYYVAALYKPAEIAVA